MLNACPKCYETITDIVNDGGSHYCSKCKITFHYCNNKINYGSPGPSLCQDCKLRYPSNDINSMTLNIINYYNHC